MNRLTKTISGYAHGAEGRSKETLTGNYCRGCFEATACVEKLAEYEDLEEQGRLLKLTCAVGDTVYVKMKFGGYAEAEVRDFTHFTSCGFCIVVTSKSFNKQNIPFSEFDKTVFLTRQEAERALAEMEGKNGN